MATRKCITIALAMVLMLYHHPMPSAAHSRESDVFYPSSDSSSGATGGCWFHYDDLGTVTAVNCYAGTWAWQDSAWWTPSGGWTMGSVIVTDPDAADSTPISRTVRNLGLTYGLAITRDDPFGDPPPDPPTTSPTNPFGAVSCDDCIRDARKDCDNVAIGTGLLVVGAAGQWTSTCIPESLPAAPATAGASTASCVLIGLGILGVGWWTAKKAQKQCYKQATFSCVDPNSGKPCYQLGYQ